MSGAGGTRRDESLDEQKLVPPNPPFFASTISTINGSRFRVVPWSCRRLVLLPRLRSLLLPPFRWTRRSELQSSKSLLFLIVIGLVRHFLPIRIGVVRGDHARLLTFRYLDRSRRRDLAILHCGELVGAIVHHLVGNRIHRIVSFYLVLLAVEFSFPCPMGRLPVLIHALH